MKNKKFRDWIKEEMARSRVNKKHAHENNDISLIGFWAGYMAGLWFALINFEEIEEEKNVKSL